MTDVILSGIQPSGKLHIGNYLGSLKNFVELQNKYDCYFFIADYHSITEDYEPKIKPQQIIDLAKDYLAAGLNPKKSNLFVQSHLPEHTELAWIFNCLTPVSYLLRMTQFKDKSAIIDLKKTVAGSNSPIEVKNKDKSLKELDLISKSTDNKALQLKLNKILDMALTERIEEVGEKVTHLKELSSLYKELNNLFKLQKSNTGLLTYPVLQAADILMYKATAVPVGVDQDQHVELTRQIARFFNNRFGKTFPEPKILHTETPKIMSIVEPEKKMSKSLGDNHCIYIEDEIDAIKEKLAKAPTDSGDATSLGAKNLLALCKIFSKAETCHKFTNDAQTGKLKYSELKNQLAADIAGYFQSYRKNKKQIKDNEVKKVLAAGAEKAAKIAKATMADVRKKIGVR
ncbi:tryptophan--tRNA ligase [Candidatus Parcubacteria bacterium]|nr:MAG: tryptophan--tRNA ligase [Candidatus Parcubacteria bacterium]